ncbi:MAG: class II glutamine amidotransferase [Deltaproteobacteria bacterium]|nr:class II glutamine amidotransferase [Deltaproteobacteria bacterium]
MTFLLGILSTHAEWLPCLLDAQREQLRIPESPEKGGWGIGFYHQGEVLRRLTPLESAMPLDFHQLAHDVRSRVLVGHVRRASSGGPSAANTHPFRHREWLFAHCGDIPEFTRLRPQLTQNMPEFLARDIAGETDSEVLFHVILTHLHELGGLREPDVNVYVIGEATRRAIHEVDEAVAAAGAAPPAFSLIVTNGASMIAACRDERMCIAQFDRLVDCRDCGEEKVRAQCEILRRERSDLRAVIVVSCPRELPPRYEGVSEESLLAIKPDATVEAIPLRPSATGGSGF